MDIIQLIKDDHRTVKGLFQRLERGGKSSDLKKLTETLVEELSLHATVEEQLVYPALRQRDEEMTDEVLEALEEHHVAKLALVEIDKMKPEDERFKAKITVLKEMIEHHVEEEEGTLLPRLVALLSDEEREAIGQAAVAVKQAAPDHPHPMAPDTPPGNFVGAMLGKILDTGKNLVRRVTDKNKAKAHEERVARTRKLAKQTVAPRRAQKSKKPSPPKRTTARKKTAARRGGKGRR